MPRLAFLTESEQQEFDYPPLLSPEARAVCFALSDKLSKKVKRLHTPTNKIGFLLQHQYYARQDTFVDILLRCVQSAKNTATHRLTESDQLSRSERRSAVRHLTKSRRVYRLLIDEITEVTTSSVLTDSGKIERITELLEQHDQEENEKEKKKIALAKDKDYFDILESLSRKLQNRVSGILKALIFNKSNSNKKLIKAIQNYKENDGKITNKAPVDFLSEAEQSALIGNKGSFRASLYKILLFIYVANAIKSGGLNVVAP